MAVDVIIDPGTGQIYWNDQAGSGTQTIAISGNATNAINVVGYSNFFSPGGGGLGTQILATFNDSATSTFTPGTNAYDLGSTSLRWNFYGTGGNFTGAISTSSTTASTSSTTGALIVSGGAGIAKTSYFAQDVKIQGSTASTSPTTGALTVTGGVGIGGKLFVGSSDGIDHNDYQAAIAASSPNGFVRTLIKNTAIGTSALGYAVLSLESFGANASLSVGSTNSFNSGGTSLFGSKSVAVEAIYDLNLKSSNSYISLAATKNIYLATGVGVTDLGGTVYIYDYIYDTPSTSTTSGHLVVYGGAGIAKTSYFGQSVFIQGTTASGSTTTGALTVAGGVGIGGSLNVFGTIDVANNIKVLSQKEVRFFNSANTFYTGLRAGSSSANVTFTLPIADGTANQVLYTNGSAGLAWTTVASVSAITTLNGLTAATQTFATGTSGTDFNISSATSTHTFNIPYAGAASTGLITTQAQTIAGAKTFSGNTAITASTASTNPTNGALVVTGGVGIGGSLWTNTTTVSSISGVQFLSSRAQNGFTINASSSYTFNIQDGANNQRLNYHADSNRTEFTGNNATHEIRLIHSNNSSYTGFKANSSGTVTYTLPAGDGSNGQVLYTNGSAGLAWTTPGSSGGGTSGVVAGGQYQIAYYTATGSSVSGSSTFLNDTAAAKVSITHTTASTSTTTGALVVSGGVGIAGSIWSGQHVITDTTASTTTATGSLLVFGGLGVSGQVNAASLQTTGNAVISGNLTFNGVGVFGNATTDTINSLARYISDILPSTDNSNDLGNNALGWRNFRISGVGTIATLQVTSVTSGVWAGTAISAVNGGTGQNTYAIGDILYASSSTALTRLAAGTAGSVLKSNGAGTAPSWQVDSTGSGGAGTVAAPTASNLVAYYPGTGASVASYNRVSIDTANSSVEIDSQNSKSALILNAVNGSVSNLAEFKNSFGDVLWSVGATAQIIRGSGSFLWLDSASTLLLTAPAAVSFYDATETYTTSITGSTNATTDLTFILPTAAGTAGSVLATAGASGQLYWSAPGAAGGSGTVTSGTAGSVAFYTGTGTTVGGAKGFTYTTSGTASTMNVFGGGGAIGTTIFTVQAYSATSIRVGIGTNLPQYELEIVGELSATNKSFVIDHPTKPGKKLRYGSLEGPENGVYVRGELKGSNIIETPDHWIGLVYPDSFTVTLTPISRFSHLYVEKIEDYKVFIADDCMNPIHCYYTVWAERKDIPKLITEY
jgi:hypothetical protein